MFQDAVIVVIKYNSPVGRKEIFMGFSKKTKAAVLAGAMALGAVSGAYAYFSGTAETKSNVFNIVAGQSDQKDTAGTILEPGWNPANAVDLEPGQEVTKDPSLKSNVEYQSWAFLQVEIPAVTAQKKGDLSDQVYDAVVLNGIDGAKWEKIREDISGEPGTDSVYIYGLKDPLAPGAETPKLFTSFTVQDFTKLEAVSDSVNVSGSLIQTTGQPTLDAAAATLGLK